MKSKSSYVVGGVVFVYSRREEAAGGRGGTVAIRGCLGVFLGLFEEALLSKLFSESGGRPMTHSTQSLGVRIYGFSELFLYRDCG